MSSNIGAINAAIRIGYRVVVHNSFFPYESTNPATPGTIHAVVDHGARAVFCSKEWLEKSRVQK